jgi:hypothetical protein
MKKKVTYFVLTICNNSNHVFKRIMNITSQKKKMYKNAYFEIAVPTPEIFVLS